MPQLVLLQQLLLVMLLLVLLLLVLLLLVQQRQARRVVGEGRLQLLQRRGAMQRLRRPPGRH